MAVVTIVEFAKLKGWSHVNVSKKIKSGIFKECLIMIQGKVKPRIDVEVAERELREKGNIQRTMSRTLVDAKKNTKPIPPADDEEDWLGAELAKGQVLSETKPKEIPKATKETRTINGKEETVTVLPPGDDQFERFRNAKTNSEAMRARKLELEVAEMEGRLLDTEEVRKQIVKRVSETRDALGNLSGKLAPLLVGISDPVLMETTLQREINKALESMAKLTASEDN